MLVTEQHLLGQCSQFAVYVTRVSLPIEEQMASVCRQVGDFHPNNRQLQQLHQPLCNWYHLVTASNHLPISQGQHDLSCWMSRLFISKTVMLWVVVGKQLFQRELVWVVWFMVIPHTTWLSWIIRCKVTKMPGVHSEWTVPQNDLLIKNEALCLRGRCAVVFCNIVWHTFSWEFEWIQSFVFSITL